MKEEHARKNDDMISTLLYFFL